jgi:flagellar biosynthesis GTPase FlhF
LANCFGLKEKMPESFHDVQVWSINWTHGGVLRHGLPNKKATKSAYIALLNGNHWGVLYNKKGFDIVFEGSSEEQAQEVARAVGKQFKGSPLTESQQLEVRQISSEEAKAEREAKAKSKAQSEADSERKEQAQGEAKEQAKSEADSERKEQAKGEAKSEAESEADSESKEQAQQIEHPPPDTANDTSEDHTHCGDPVLLIFTGSRYALGCEKCMRTWATGINTRAQQWAAKMEFEINDGEQKWLEESGNRNNDRVHMAQIKAAVDGIHIMDERSLAREFKWTEPEKRKAYGFKPVPKQLWIYKAKLGDY